MNRVRRAAVVSVVVLLSTAPLARGQQSLGQLIPNLFDRTIELAATGHEAHFTDSSAELFEAGLQINNSVLTQLTSYPVTSSAGGFTFEFDPALGVLTRSTESFGPIFAERAETIGKGKWNFGVKFQRFDYDAIDGLDLESGDLALSFTHLDTNADGTTVESVYEGDILLADARLGLTSETTVFSAHVGLSDSFDLTVAVPVVRNELRAALDTRVLRLATEGFEDPPAHVFEDGSDTATFSSSGDAAGLGDVLIRGKWSFAEEPGRGLAAALDVRLPTGDEEELLGSGSTQARLTLIGSSTFGRFAPHVNVGYAAYLEDGPSNLELPDEGSLTVGFDWAAHPRVTVAADLLWRTLFDAQQIEAGDEGHLYRRFDETQIRTYERPTLDTERDDLNLISAAIGCRVNLWGQVLLTGNLLVSLSDDGLQDESVVPLIALDYSF